MTIADIQKEIVQEFSFFENWEDKYQYIIDLGRDLPPMDSTLKTEDNKVRGCQSQVWLHAEMRNGNLHFDADSDAVIVKGLVALLMRVFNDQPPAEILASNVDFIEKIGLSTHLSPTRSNGLAAMIKRIRAFAAGLNA